MLIQTQKVISAVTNSKNSKTTLFTNIKLFEGHATEFKHPHLGIFSFGRTLMKIALYKPKIGWASQLKGAMRTEQFC